MGTERMNMGGEKKKNGAPPESYSASGLREGKIQRRGCRGCQVASTYLNLPNIRKLSGKGRHPSKTLTDRGSLPGGLSLGGVQEKGKSSVPRVNATRAKPQQRGRRLTVKRQKSAD